MRFVLRLPELRAADSDTSESNATISFGDAVVRPWSAVPGVLDLGYLACVIMSSITAAQYAIRASD